MSASKAVQNYELLAELTVQMLQAAKEEKWDALIEIEQQCSNLIATMKLVDAKTQLDQTDLQHKNELIEKILADEAEIRRYTETWMTQLQELMQSNSQEQRLQKTYGL